MMRILVVHDRDAVAAELQEVIQAALSECRIDVAGNYLAAHDLLRANLYDLAIVDLTLPFNARDDQPNLANAEDLLKRMFEDPEFHPPGDILGITNDKDSLMLVRNSIGEHLMGCIREDAANLWKTSVADRLKYVERARLGREAVSRARHDIDLLILTALDSELKPYHELFGLRDDPSFAGAHRFNFRSNDGKLRRGIAYSIDQAGPAPTASICQALLAQFRPRLSMMTGFCGGVKGRAAVGDLLPIQTAFAWDSGKWVDSKTDPIAKPKFRPRPTPLSVPDEGIVDTVRALKADYQPDADIVAQVNKLSGDKIKGWCVKPTSAGSGSAVVTSLDILTQITDLDDAIWAIDMESYAFYHACRKTKVVKSDFMCVKAVADYCNGAKSSRYHAACSLISAAFAKDIVTKHYTFANE